MICKNCGKVFDGKFCPECGTKLEEVGQELTQCPQCGSERIDNGKFCINCGYNYLEPMQSHKPEEVTTQEVVVNNGKKFDVNKFLNIFSKIYRWLLAGGMILVGIVSLLCLTAPILKEDFLGEVNNLCTGFQAIGGKEVDVPSQAVNASVMLLVVSLIALVYGGVQLFFAFKKPYINIIGRKKFVFWGIDGAISLVLIILGAVVAQQANSEELMDAKLGSGFAMAIVMGVFGLLFLGARIFYELKIFKWEDTGLSEEQVAKITEKKERKKLTKKQIMAIVMPVVTVAVLIAVIVPSVSWATNIFRIGKVDKINIGDSQEQVIKILGEPFNKNEYSYEYYSDNYLKVLRQLDKLNGNERGLTSLASSDDDFDDIDWGDEDFGEDKETKLEEQLRQMTYQYIRVEFDSDKKVSSVLFDAEKCDSKEYKKVVKSSELATKEAMKYVAVDIAYKTKYTDGSLYKYIVIPGYVAGLSQNNKKYEWTDLWDNKFSDNIRVSEIENPNLKLRGVFEEDSYFEIDGNDILTLYNIDKAVEEDEKYSARTFISDLVGIKVDESNTIYYAEGNCLIRKSTNDLVLGCKNSIIPSSVTSIGDYAFSGCSNLTSIEIPSSVTSIGDYAFSGCGSLTSIEMPSSVTRIGELAFYWCSSLTSIVIPSSVTSLGNYAFSGCSSLTSIVIPSSVTSLGNYAFSGCSSLTSVVIPSTITSIGNGVFYSCSSLTSIVIPSSVTSIGNDAFSGCSSLTSIEIPSSVTSIGNDAFSGCSSLTSIVIPSSVTSIGSSAFYDCSSLTSVVIPSSVTSIGNYAFSGCSSLTSVVIPSTITSIGNGVFYSCSSLTSIVIPSSVTSIGNDAFSGCSSLTSVVIPSSVTSIGNSAFRGCSSLTSIEIPSSVTSIGSSAFSGCSSLTRVVIPSSVTIIGEFAFLGCSSLTIYCEAQSKPSGWDIDWNYSSGHVVWGYKK